MMSPHVFPQACQISAPSDLPMTDGARACQTAPGRCGLWEGSSRARRPAGFMAPFLLGVLAFAPRRTHNTQMPQQDDGKSGLLGAVGVFLGTLRHFWLLVTSMIRPNLAAGAHGAAAQRGEEQVGRAWTELHWDRSCG